MVIFHSFLYVYQRVTTISCRFSSVHQGGEWFDSVSCCVTFTRAGTVCFARAAGGVTFLNRMNHVMSPLPVTDPWWWYINANMNGGYWWDPWSTINIAAPWIRHGDVDLRWDKGTSTGFFLGFTSQKDGFPAICSFTNPTNTLDVAGKFSLISVYICHVQRLLEEYPRAVGISPTTNGIHIWIHLACATALREYWRGLRMPTDAYGLWFQADWFPTQQWFGSEVGESSRFSCLPPRQLDLSLWQSFWGIKDREKDTMAFRHTHFDGIDAKLFVGSDLGSHWLFSWAKWNTQEVGNDTTETWQVWKGFLATWC